MKALSIRQPWAELIVRGLQDVENRTWRAHHRGPLLIHATQGADEAWYGDFGIPEDAPRGALVGVVDVINCTRQRTNPWHGAGNWGFYLGNPRRFPRPIPSAGTLGLYDVPGRKVSRAVAAARADRQHPLDVSLVSLAPPSRRLTMFSWGYEGWGNATRQLVRSFDLAEAYRRHTPPIFVDIRMSRSVRAVGFRDHTFGCLGTSVTDGSALSATRPSSVPGETKAVFNVPTRYTSWWTLRSMLHANAAGSSSSAAVAAPSRREDVTDSTWRSSSAGWPLSGV